MPTHLDGESFVALLKNPELEGKPAAIGRFKDGDTIGTERYWFSEYLQSKGGQISRMIYDHHKNPEENVNVSDWAKRAEVVERLTAELHGGMGKQELK